MKTVEIPMAALLFVGIAYVFFVAALGISKALFASSHPEWSQDTARVDDDRRNDLEKR